MDLSIVETPIPGMVVVESDRRADERGYFVRAFCDRELSEVVAKRAIRQINISKTTQIGTVRGFHFQYPPAAELKLVRCLQGCVWDVTVDLRCNSPSFLQWHSVELSAKQAKMVIIPEGCAHGFQVLATDSELLYLHTSPYTPALEGGLRYNDPTLQVTWPLAVTEL
ncbi:MAG: dTDP-4-dehydrorhamnose 3,5-epimerase family protein [Cyanobacteria bacterium P01_H01_bin.121]